MASQNRSLFAAKCLVETLIAIYQRGFTLDEIKMDVTLATLASADPFKPIMMDVLLTWTAVVMMTLRAVGVPLLPEGEARVARRAASDSEDADSAEHEDRMTQGLEFFVNSCVERYQSGTDLFRLQLQQSMQGPLQVDSNDAAGESPTVAVLQQNTRLSIITLEVVKNLGVPTAVPLRPDGDADADAAAASTSRGPGEPVGFIAAFIDADKAPAPGLTGPQRAAALRSAGVRALVGFNGAVLGYLRSAKDFVREVAAAYAAGWTAEELFTAVHDEEFAQSGGVTRFNLANAPGGKHISATLFARWVSLIYMTLAQLAVPRPGADTEAPGWAWVPAMSGGSEDVPSGIEAHGVADFVASTLRNAVLSDEESGGDEEARDAGGRRGVRENQANMPPMDGYEALGSVSDAEEESAGAGFATTAFEDPKLMQTSSFALILSQEISLVRLTRLVVLQQRSMEAAMA